MIFQHTWEKVLTGEKTQTRRLVKPDQWIETVYYDAPQMYVYTGGSQRRCVYGTFHSVLYPKTYAVQPGRGQKAVGRIRITHIRREDVRNISEEDARAEGFTDIDDFLETWCGMHDPSILPFFTAMYRRGWLETQPASRYDAWVIAFELVADKGK